MEELDQALRVETASVSSLDHRRPGHGRRSGGQRHMDETEGRMKKPSQPAEVTSRGLVRLDKLLEHRSRLGACVLLADVEAMTFTSLKQLLQETDGNLGAHLRKLEDAGYLSSTPPTAQQLDGVVEKVDEHPRPDADFKRLARGSRNRGVAATASQNAPRVSNCNTSSVPPLGFSRKSLPYIHL